ncbi:hypothetical protein C8R44DRAFT_750387 [Mycena epipterygia]|nr:hypothetical protein C8R44DRAFT_750387 [Mycena epipterygia]
MPTGAPPALEEALRNCLAVVDGVRAKDIEEEEEGGQDFQVTEWASRSDGALNQPVDIILLRLAPTYEVPVHSRIKRASGGADPSPAKSRPRVQKTQPAAADIEMKSTAESQVKPRRKIGDTYPPDALPDHRGPYFDHQQSKLVQRDYRCRKNTIYLIRG